MAEPSTVSAAPVANNAGSQAHSLPEPEDSYKPMSRDISAHYKPMSRDISAHGIRDLGWGEDPKQMRRMLEGIDNEDVWKLVRRLDKVTFHIKTTTRLPSDQLDLTASPDQEFSPNKMRSQVERLYLGVLLGALGTLKHVSRLRSWGEPRRTMLFGVAYFSAWATDYLTFATLVLILALVGFPKARRLLFPPAPLSLVGSLSGEITKPNAGVLGSVDSVTGAPENLKGEAVENEVSNFVTALGAVAANIVSAEDPQGEPNTEEEGLKGPMAADPNEIATMMATAKDKAEGVERPSQDKSKKPMETIVWNKVPPAMRALAQICDFWEKFANLIDPSPPLDLTRQRRLLITAIVTLAAISLYLDRDLVFRTSTFLLGIGLFGNPLIKQALRQLNSIYPCWYDTISINNNILKGVPTHPQLALELLRHGESRKAPLPPPPRIYTDPPLEPIPLSKDVMDTLGDDKPLGATDAQLEALAARDDHMVDEAGGDDTEVSKSGSKEPHRALKVIKGAMKVGIKGAVNIDKLRAKAGKEGSKNRYGVVPAQRHPHVVGPVEFDARYQGQKGFIYINTNNATGRAIIEFNKESKFEKVGGVGVNHHDSTAKPLWTLAVDDIAEMRKHSGYGYRSKLTVGWALDKELNDSLGITDKTGESRAVTAIPRRDALFNRLLSIGEQRWEVW